MKKLRIENLPKKVDQGGLLQQLNWFSINSNLNESKSFLYDYLLSLGKTSVVDSLKKIDFEFHP